MKQINNWNEIQENDGFDSIKPGGYVATILGIEDVPDKEYLLVNFDVTEGEYKDYYRNMWKATNYWAGRVFRSYKETALSMFKSFISSVEKSNIGYIWNWDEQSLKGKKIGIVLGEEEYIPTGGNHAGELRTRTIVTRVCTVDDIRNKKFKVPDKKKINKFGGNEQRAQPTQSTPAPVDISNDSLPF